MRITKTELAEHLRLHSLWLNGKSGGVRLDLVGYDLSGAYLSRANLSRANLSGANLSYANLSYANLSGTNLSGANLSYANLSDAKLSDANLSGTTGLLSQSKFLAQFERTTEGIIVYKAIGKTSYALPAHWKIEPHSYLEEVVNPDRCTLCGCGVNVASLEWCKRHYAEAEYWRCLIPSDCYDIVVPYNTDGKFRVGKLKLIERVV